MTDTGQRDIVRKKICLTVYHDELLREIVEQRYASRSEAVRAAIQHHAQYLSEGGETNIEAIHTDIEQIAKEIETVREKIEEKNHNVIHVSEQNLDNVENRSQSRTNSRTEMDIVRELSISEKLSINEIEEKIEDNLVLVIPAIKSLENKGVICPVSDNVEKYELNK